MRVPRKKGETNTFISYDVQRQRAFATRRAHAKALISDGGSSGDVDKMLFGVDETKNKMNEGEENSYFEL